MTKQQRLPAPELIAFDCYRTLLTNNPADWAPTFAGIAKEQRLRLSGPELWTRWKAHEVHFRATRLDTNAPEASRRFKTYREAWASCFADVYAESGERGDPDAAAQICVGHMGRRPAFTETVQALQSLTGRVRLAVLSNADDAFLLPALSKLPLKFEAVMSSESARTYKPAPAIFAVLSARTGVPGPRTWYVGDHLNEDVRGSTEAGMTSIWVNRAGGEAYYAGQVGVGPDVPRPHAEIASLTEIVNLLDNSVK